MARLTRKQQLFCDYYLETGNGHESAVRAGYSEKTARSIASENLTKPNIQEYLQKREAELNEQRIADISEVRRFWTSLMRGEPIGEEEGERVFASTADRIKASELLGRSGGAFLDKVEHSGGVSIKVEWE